MPDRVFIPTKSQVVIHVHSECECTIQSECECTDVPPTSVNFISVELLARLLTLSTKCERIPPAATCSPSTCSAMRTSSRRSRPTRPPIFAVKGVSPALRLPQPQPLPLCAGLHARPAARAGRLDVGRRRMDAEWRRQRAPPQCPPPSPRAAQPRAGGPFPHCSAATSDTPASPNSRKCDETRTSAPPSPPSVTATVIADDIAALGRRDPFEREHDSAWPEWLADRRLLEETARAFNHQCPWALHPDLAPNPAGSPSGPDPLREEWPRPPYQHRAQA